MDAWDFPRSLRHRAAVDARRAMLHDAHMVALSAYVARLRVIRPDWEFPEFDPLDGGDQARIIFLFEKPGPMTSVGGMGSGFISRNNDDPTAAATYAFMEAANLPRKATISWNIVPGWNGTRQIKAAELENGLAMLRELLGLIPRLQTAVLVGRKAERAEGFVKALGLKPFVSPHPSPLVRAAHRARWEAIPRIWSEAGRTQHE